MLLGEWTLALFPKAILNNPRIHSKELMQRPCLLDVHQTTHKLIEHAIDCQGAISINLLNT
jgi:hypothetical protein